MCRHHNFHSWGSHLLGGCLGPGTLDHSQCGKPFENVAASTLLHSGKSWLNLFEFGHPAEVDVGSSVSGSSMQILIEQCKKQISHHLSKFSLFVL